MLRGMLVTARAHRSPPSWGGAPRVQDRISRADADDSAIVPAHYTTCVTPSQCITLAHLGPRDAAGSRSHPPHCPASPLGHDNPSPHRAQEPSVIAEQGRQ
jgi:hypothetical protein